MIPADKQKAFEVVWFHLRRQRKRALKGRARCAYLADDGSKCAIGIFISDGHPAQLQTDGVYRLRDRFPDLFEAGCEDRFLGDLQFAHDRADDNKFRKRLVAVAKRWGLTIPTKEPA